MTRYLLLPALIFLLLPVQAQADWHPSAPPSANSSLPVKAEVVNLSKKDGWEVGDIQVTFANGTTELVTHGGLCERPAVSGKGAVGWSVWNNFDSTLTRYFHSGETLKVRMADGTIKSFAPNSLFIMKWAFVDQDAAVVIKSMQHHGPSYYVKYDLATGKELGRVDGYKPYAELPAWAKPFDEEDK